VVSVVRCHLLPSPVLIVLFRYSLLRTVALFNIVLIGAIAAAFVLFSSLLYMSNNRRVLFNVRIGLV